MTSPRSQKVPIWLQKAFFGMALAVLCIFFAGAGELFAQKNLSKSSPKREAAGELSWEIPGRVSIYDLQFGPAVLKNNEWNFVDNVRTMDAGKFVDRLTLMVRFSYKGSKSEIPLKFIIRLPGARQVPKKQCSCPHMKVNIVIDSQSTTLKTSWAADRFTFITVLAWWMCLILQLFLVLRY